MKNDKFIPIETQLELDTVINRIDWEDAFIREAYLVAPTYIQKNGGLVAPYVDPDLKMIIVCPNGEIRGIELRLQQVSQFMVTSARNPLLLSGKVGHINSSVELNLYKVKNLQPDIIATKLYYRFLGESAIGHELHYGFEDVFHPSDGSRNMT